MASPRTYARLDVLLALGVLTSLETQLRFVVGGLDPGAMLLALWIVACGFLEWRRPREAPPKFAFELAIFWMTIAFGLSLGLSFSILSGEMLDLGLVLHDTLAYSLLAVITSLLALDVNVAHRLRRVQWIIVVVGSVLMIIQIAESMGMLAIPNIDPWYWDRWRAWTDNPNQLALFCLLLAFTALHLAHSETGALKRTTAIFAMALFLGAGTMAKSNAFLLAALMGFGVLVAAKFVRLIWRLERLRVPAAAISMAAMALSVYIGVIGMGLSASSHLSLASAAGGVARQDRNGDEETALRFVLWGEALDRAANSWMIGLGPGPHLPIPQIILSGRRGGALPKNVQNPKPGSAPNFETHDTTLEFLVQGGIIAVAAAGSLCGLALARAFRAGLDGLAAALIAIGLFGAFHVVFRHPFIWVLLCSALCAVERRRIASPSAANGVAPPTSTFPPRSWAAGAVLPRYPFAVSPSRWIDP
jgi:hypothetical protein